MTIPTYQTLMLPVLKAANDNQLWTVQKIARAMGNLFQLPEEEIERRIPSGLRTYLESRANWALYYMKRAGLFESPKRGQYQISERGKQVLGENIQELDSKYLLRFKEFQEFLQKTNEDNNPNETNESSSVETDTPEVILEQAFQKINNSLKIELLEKVHSQSPEFFEKLVVELIIKMGYGGSALEAGKAIGKSGDEGIDGVIKEDKLGLDIIYIQAKRWDLNSTVGRPEIQKFVGALAGQGAKKGIFITTAKFTRDALEYAPKNETKVVLIDGNRLAQLMVEFDVGVSPVNKYEIKKMDLDYFEE